MIEREGLVERVKQLEPVLADALRPLADHPAVADVRAGVGLLGAVELADPSKLQAVIDAAYERGVLVRGIRGVALQVSPPFVITEDEIATTARVLRRALDAPRSAQTSRCWVAQRVSSWRVESWSLRSTLETWLSTVFTERCSRAAISLYM